MKKLLERLILSLALVMTFTAFAFSQYTVSGTVTDQTGEVLIGVSVLVQGTTIGTITDIDGTYSLEVANDPATLVFSYLGYASSSVQVSSDSNLLDIELSEQTSRLDEVVITGLATSVKRSNLANAVASISAEELTGVTPQNTVDGALYGKFKGADIRANSGAPGGGFSIRLRGVTSVFNC